MHDTTKRNCDWCSIGYLADNRNLKRGWGLCCSKSCASKKREKKTGHFKTLLQNKSNTNNYLSNIFSRKLRYAPDENFEKYGEEVDY